MPCEWWRLELYRQIVWKCVCADECTSCSRNEDLIARGPSALYAINKSDDQKYSDFTLHVIAVGGGEGEFY